MRCARKRPVKSHRSARDCRNGDLTGARHTKGRILGRDRRQVTRRVCDGGEQMIFSGGQKGTRTCGRRASIDIERCRASVPRPGDDLARWKVSYRAVEHCRIGTHRSNAGDHPTHFPKRKTPHFHYPDRSSERLREKNRCRDQVRYTRAIVVSELCNVNLG